MKRVLRLAAIVALMAVPPVMAERLIPVEELLALDGAREWPVIDARDLAEQSYMPIPGAVDYGLRPEGEGRQVLVVASDDLMAVSAARTVEKRWPEFNAFAVAGGYESLRALKPELPPAVDTPMPGSFTIPSDTCQPGEPLHVYESEESAGDTARQ